MLLGVAPFSKANPSLVSGFLPLLCDFEKHWYG